jgi:RNA-directed DNA polymerase
MKRYGNLFDKIVFMDNLKLAYKLARKGKSHKSNLKYIDDNIDELLIKLQKDLINGTYKTSEYRTRLIHEPKERLIYVLPFYPDRIVHHAIMNVLEPIWDKFMINESYSCRKDKGQHKASQKVMEFNRKYDYCFKGDIHHFYPSINHQILKRIIKHKIKDQRVLDLLFEIIDSVEGEVNVPIGNYLSQWFGNLYMNEFDHYVKQVLHIEGYVRYCDDFLIYSNSKEELHYIESKITDYLNNELELTLSKNKILRVIDGIDFLGYKHFKDYVIVRKSTVKNMKSNIKSIPHLIQLGVLTFEKFRSKVASIYGWIKHACSHNLMVSMDLQNLNYIILGGF